MELRNWSTEWEEIRACSTIRNMQDRLVQHLDLRATDIPILLNESAVIALLPGLRPDSVIPVTVLRPADTSLALSLPERLEGTSSHNWVVVEDRGAVWLAPVAEPEWLQALARGDGTSLTPHLGLGEVKMHLGDGGLVQGWVNPMGLKGFLQEMTPGKLPGWMDAIVSCMRAEIEALIFAAFHRRLQGEDVVTEAVVGYDIEKLPPEIVDSLSPAAKAPPVPKFLPSETIFYAAFRTERQAWLPYLRYVAAQDPQGPFRNVDFWIAEFEERTGIDLQRRIKQGIGQFGWLALLEGGKSAPSHPLVILQSDDPAGANNLIEIFTEWSREQIRARSLGLVVPQVQRGSFGQTTYTRVDFWTPAAVYTGPIFAAFEGHILVGFDEESIQTAMEMVKDGCFDGGDGEVIVAPHGVISFDGRYLANLAGLLVQIQNSEKQIFADTILELVESIRGGTIQLWYEGETLRFRSRIGVGSLLHAEGFDGADPDGAPGRQETSHQGYDEKKQD
jgi:hypothetical protein